MTTYQLSGEQLETLLGQAWDRGWAARHASSDLAIGGAQRYAAKELTTLTPAPEPAGEPQKHAEEAARQAWLRCPEPREAYWRNGAADPWLLDALSSVVPALADAAHEAFMAEIRRLIGEGAG